MARRISSGRVKVNLAYTVEEAADVIGVTQQTVRNWIKRDGLQALNSKLPMLILGSELKQFLKNRSSTTKQPMALDEFYCCRCRRPQKPYGMMADYISFSDSRGQLKALCSGCECELFRFVSRPRLAEISTILDIAIGSPKRD